MSSDHTTETYAHWSIGTAPAMPAARSLGSIENPRVPLSKAADELGEVFGGKETDAGVRVSREVALTLAAVWRAINIVSRDFAKLPVHVYERLDGDDRRRATEHPAYRLLRRKPNSELTSFAWKQTMIGHALACGNGYSYVYRNGDGSPRELVLLLPDRTWPVRAGGRLFYVTLIDGRQETLSPADVIHFKGFCYDGLAGYNVIEKARQSLGWEIAKRRYSAAFFKNGSRTTGILQMPGNIKGPAAENLYKSFTDRYTQLANSHKVILLEEGAKFVPTSITNDEAQFLQSMEFGLLDVANWFGLSPHKLGHPGRTSFASLQEENQRHLDEAIDPWLVMAEEETADKLLTEEQKAADSHYVEANRDALVRVNYKDKVEGLAKEIQAGILNPDEARATLNRGRRKDGLGQKYLMPAGVTFADSAEPGGSAGPGPVATPDPQRNLRMDQAHRDLLSDAGRRLTARILAEAKRLASKPDRFAAWAKTLRDDLATIAAEIVSPAIAAVAAADRADPVAVLDHVLGRGWLEPICEDLQALAADAGDDLDRQVGRYAALLERTGPSGLIVSARYQCLLSPINVPEAAFTGAAGAARGNTPTEG